MKKTTEVQRYEQTKLKKNQYRTCFNEELHFHSIDKQEPVPVSTIQRNFVQLLFETQQKKIVNTHKNQQIIAAQLFTKH